MENRGSINDPSAFARAAAARPPQAATDAAAAAAESDAADAPDAEQRREVMRQLTALRFLVGRRPDCLAKINELEARVRALPPGALLPNRAK